MSQSVSIPLDTSFKSQTEVSYTFNSDEEDINDSFENYMFKTIIAPKNQIVMTDNLYKDSPDQNNTGNLTLDNNEQKASSNFIINNFVTEIISNSVEISEKNKEKKKIEEENLYFSSLTYMQKKLYIYEKEMKSQFCSLSGMKKSYSTIEREKMKLKENKNNQEEITSNSKITCSYKNNEIKIENNEKKFDFVFVGKKRNFNELKVDGNKENQTQNQEYHSGYTPIKKKKCIVQENYEDFGTFMSKIKKSKPIIQIQKERFLEEQRKKNQS